MEKRPQGCDQVVNSGYQLTGNILGRFLCLGPHIPCRTSPVPQRTPLCLAIHLVILHQILRSSLDVNRSLRVSRVLYPAGVDEVGGEVDTDGMGGADSIAVLGGSVAGVDRVVGEKLHLC